MEKILKFVYADELKNMFRVYGHFYNLMIEREKFKCRSVLEIISKKSVYPNSDPVDAVVIMMNPGSSKPADKNYVPKDYKLNNMYSSTWVKEFIPTKPDNAQYQIMRLMLLQNWNYVRVINLSDLRNGNSGKFMEDYNRFSAIHNTYAHSIFHPSRKYELKNCFNIGSKSMVVLAWGAESILIPLANMAVKYLQGYNCIGISCDKEKPFYSYPSPYMKSRKLLWLENINKEITEFNPRPCRRAVQH